MSLLAAELSFWQILRVVHENHNRLGSALKTSCLSPGEASHFARIVYAVSFQNLADLMSNLWAFAIATDVLSNDFGNSHLDVHIQFLGVEAVDDLLSFLLLAIPLFEELHTGESLYNFFAKVFNAMCPCWKGKTFGLSTDGAPNMTGANVGFTAQLTDAVINHMFYRV